MMIRTLLLFVATVTAVAAAASRPPHSKEKHDRPPRHHPTSHEERQQQAQGRRRLQQPALSNESASARLRTTLLANYDKGSYPWTVLWDGDNEPDKLRSGLNVSLDLNFHKVFDIDITNSVVDLIVWVRQSWHDPRLAWDPADYDGLKDAWFWIGDGSGAGGETSEIWTPDLELWNMEESLSDSLTDTHAIVDPDGTVFWSRPGHIKPVCKFKGLDEFPFDSLKCTIEIGSWSFSGLYLRPVLKNGIGYSLGGSNTAGEAFAEYSLVKVEAEEHIYPPYPAAPSEDWPVLFYHVTFERAWEPYARGYLILQIVLNVAAFCCFWLPPHIGERMSLSITALLAAVASELVVSANLPAASEVTWFAKFSLVSLMFAAMALFESAIVIYFYYKTGDDLIPDWVHWSMKKYKKWRSNRLEKKKSRLTSDGDDDYEEDPPVNGDSVPAFEYDVGQQVLAPIEESERSGGDRDSSKDSGNDDGDSNNEGSLRISLNRRDSDDLHLDSPNTSKRKTLMKVPDSHRQLRPSIKEFKRKLSVSTRNGIKTVMGRDADDFKNAREMNNNLYWQKWSRNIDDFSRVVFPLAFCIFLSVALSGTRK